MSNSIFKVGAYVIYYPGYGPPQFGRIKELNGDHAYVVYNCDKEWDNFQDYTGIKTPQEHLHPLHNI